MLGLEEIMVNLQAIFQVQYPDKWLDYVRESVEDEVHARKMADRIAKETGKAVRFRIENWSIDRAPIIYVGAWDKDQLSPAQQTSGVFKTI
jgi:hypothetical protein